MIPALPSASLGRGDPVSDGVNDLAVTTEIVSAPTLHRRLFRKYATLFVLAVGAALITSSVMGIWISYRDHTASLIRIQHEQAEAAAGKIGEFIRDIQAQIGWTTQLPWSDYPLANQQIDALRLLRLVPAITELARLDPSGREQLRVSRLTASLIGSNIDRSQDPKFVEATAHKAYYGPVYFRRETDPYMSLAVAGPDPDSGVSVAEVDLRFILDVVSQIKVGERGQAYVVDADGRLIAHPDLDLVLQNTDLSQLAQVQAARTRGSGLAPPEAHLAKNPTGRLVLTADAAIAPLGWLVFVELPIDEAYAPLYASLSLSVALLLGGLGCAVLLSLLLARRMVRPIQALQTGAARIGAGALDHRIQIATGDELEALGDQFNSMAARLQDSYATLEGKVVERTRQLELADLAKTRFLAAASHDLRQPLHAVGLLVAQLDADTNRADRRRTVAQVGTAVAAMNDLFNALLDISKLDAGGVAPDVTAFPIDPLLRKIANMCAGDARAKSLRLRILPSNAWVRSDRVLLQRILLNLVSNAIRYTEHGGIVVGCRPRGNALRIEVWDSGIGIPEDQRQNIFREFYQVAGARAGAAGLGLGLAIVERLCHLLDHPIELASTRGKGSRFSVTVPRTPAQVEPAEIPSSLRTAIEPLAGKHVVVIDDDRLVLDGMGGLLRSWGCRVSVSTSSSEALAELFALRQQPDFIICDYHFTHGEIGIAVIERLRHTFAAPIPALLVTGDISVERKQEAEAGGYEVLQKPVPPMVLRATLHGILKQHGPIDASQPPKRRVSRSNLRAPAIPSPARRP
jgi:signal transduction histidine kinase/CheY-like chemotaxis protein